MNTTTMTATAPTAYTIVDTQDRSVLSEGRNYGMGFAFCRLEGSTATTVMPISPCKDYLNDQVYSEITGKPYGAWGFHSKQEKIFVDGKAFLAISICKQKSGRGFIDYTNREKDTAALNANLSNMQAFVNWFEEKLGLDSRTEIHATGDNMALVILPDFWVKGTYLISLVTLLIRIALYYNGGDQMAFCKSITGADQYYMTDVVPKIERMLKGEVPEQDFTKSFGVHDCGIIGYQFP